MTYEPGLTELRSAILHAHIVAIEARRDGRHVKIIELMDLEVKLAEAQYDYARHVRETTPQSSSTSPRVLPSPTDKAIAQIDGGDAQAARLLSYFGYILRRSGSWGVRAIHDVRILNSSLLHWEALHDFQEGDLRAPVLSADLRKHAYCRRYTFRASDGHTPETSQADAIARSFVVLRGCTFADASRMFGTLGLAALAAALVQARSVDDAFAEAFPSLTQELTLLLNSLADSHSLKGEKSAEHRTVFAVLKLRAPEATMCATAALEHMIPGYVASRVASIMI
ncbi:unnamed protein product [Peniophora sp. CBMAI 1063]|nr:unnamed protein product [Peniophora sp. CBMAI 1063]